MTLSKTRQTQVMLLLAPYLFAVPGHLCMLRPLIFKRLRTGLAKVLPAGKLTDKSGLNVIKVKKIGKTVLNRNAQPQKRNVLGHLYVAILLHNMALSILPASGAVGYVAFGVALPVKRLCPLRI